MIDAFTRALEVIFGPLINNYSFFINNDNFVFKYYFEYLAHNAGKVISKVYNIIRDQETTVPRLTGKIT